MIDASPVQYPLRDDAAGGAGPLLATLVVNPNQNALQAAVSRALMTLCIVLGITALAGVIVAQSLSRAMLRPVAELTAWAEEVSKLRNLATVAPMPQSGAHEVNRLTGSFERLVSQVAEQNRELKRKQYELKASNAHLETMAFSDFAHRTAEPAAVRIAIDMRRLIRPMQRDIRWRCCLSTLIISRRSMINLVTRLAMPRCATQPAFAGTARYRLPARLAGDEFVVISPNVTSVDDAVRLGERLTVWLGIALPEDRWSNPVRASIGVAGFPIMARMCRRWYAADLAMYRPRPCPVTTRYGSAVPLTCRAIQRRWRLAVQCCQPDRKAGANHRRENHDQFLYCRSLNAVLAVTLLLVLFWPTASPGWCKPREARLAALGFERTDDGYVLNLPGRCCSTLGAIERKRQGATWRSWRKICTA